MNYLMLFEVLYLNLLDYPEIIDLELNTYMGSSFPKIKSLVIFFHFLTKNVSLWIFIDNTWKRLHNKSFFLAILVRVSSALIKISCKRELLKPGLKS